MKGVLCTLHTWGPALADVRSLLMGDQEALSLARNRAQPVSLPRLSLFPNRTVRSQRFVVCCSVQSCHPVFSPPLLQQSHISPTQAQVSTTTPRDHLLDAEIIRFSVSPSPLSTRLVSNPSAYLSICLSPPARKQLKTDREQRITLLFAGRPLRESRGREHPTHTHKVPPPPCFGLAPRSVKRQRFGSELPAAVGSCMYV